MKVIAKTVFLALLGWAATAPLEAAPTAGKPDSAKREPGTVTVRCSYQARMGSNVKQKVCKDIHWSGNVADRDAYNRMKRCRDLACSGRDTYRRDSTGRRM